MLYCHNPESEEPILLLNKHIGNDAEDGIGIDGALFMQELLILDGMGKKRIIIWINSPGGIVMDGYNIFCAILKSKTKVDTYCVGIAASIAAVIFQAGRKRVMADYAKLMYHNPYGADTKSLDPMKDSIAIMVASRIKQEKDSVLDVMKKTTWMSAEEALKDGYCDEIESSTEHNRPRASAGDTKALWKESDEILNSIIKPKQTEESMDKVKNRLGLVKDANEDSVLAALDAVENKAKLDAKNAADKIKDLENAFKEKEKEAKDAKDALDKMTAEKDKADKEAKEAQDAKNAAECKNVLDKFVEQGRIKADSVADWTQTANVIGIAKVKAQLEQLPVNRVSNKIKVNDVNNVVNDAKLTNVVAGAMAQIREKNKI